MGTTKGRRTKKLKMTDFRKNNNRESSEILTSITMVSDMPPSYDVAIENVTASHQKLFNSTKTELPNIFDSTDYEMGRLEKEIERLNKIISTKDKLLKSILGSILVSILLIVIVNVIVVTYFDLWIFQQLNSNVILNCEESYLNSIETKSEI